VNLLIYREEKPLEEKIYRSKNRRQDRGFRSARRKENDLYYEERRARPEAIEKKGGKSQGGGWQNLILRSRVKMLSLVKGMAATGPLQER